MSFRALGLHSMVSSIGEPQKAAPASAEPASQPEPVDFSEALLSSEKLPVDLSQDDAPAGAQNAEGQQKGMPLPHCLTALQASVSVYASSCPA